MAASDVPNASDTLPATSSSPAEKRRNTLLFLLIIFGLTIICTGLAFLCYMVTKLPALLTAVGGSIVTGVVVILGQWIKQVIPETGKKKVEDFVAREEISLFKMYQRSYQLPSLLGSLGILLLCFLILFEIIVPHIVDPYTTRGWPTFSDSLQRSSNTDDQWDNNGIGSKGGCQLTTQGYQVVDNVSDTWLGCAAELPQYQNFVLQARLTISTGGDCGGFLLRDHPNISTAYVLRICSNGSYRLAHYSSGSGFNQFNPPCLVAKGQAPPVDCQVMVGHYAHPSQSYVLAIVVDGNTFTVYVNHEPLQSQDDTTNTTEGHIGFIADTVFNHPTAVTYTDVSVWTLEGAS